MYIEEVLLVEDNPDDIELTLRAFRKNQILHNIVIVKDGEEALNYLTATGKYVGRNINQIPQLILLDLKIPKIDGLEVLRQIRDNESTKNLPIIVILTSSREQEDLINGYKFGANSYIRKPVDFDKFMDTVRQLGSYWLTLNECPTIKG